MADDIQTRVREQAARVARLLRWATSKKERQKYSKKRLRHFQKVLAQAYEEQRAAKRDSPEFDAAVAKRTRALRKVAFWMATVDRQKQGIGKTVKRLRRQRKKLKFMKAHASQVTASSGRVYPDRVWNPLHKPVAGWFVPILDEAHDRGWRGYVVSGVRTPEESVAACHVICGQDSCSGTCAGVNSNHNCTGCQKPEGAVDVTDYWTFAAIMKAMGNPIFNALPNDRVHFSATGH